MKYRSNNNDISLKQKKNTSFFKYRFYHTIQTYYRKLEMYIINAYLLFFKEWGVHFVYGKKYPPKLETDMTHSSKSAPLFFLTINNIRGEANQF